MRMTWARIDGLGHVIVLGEKGSGGLARQAAAQWRSLEARSLREQVAEEQSVARGDGLFGSLEYANTCRGSVDKGGRGNMEKDGAARLRPARRADHRQYHLDGTSAAAAWARSTTTSACGAVAVKILVGGRLDDQQRYAASSAKAMAQLAPRHRSTSAARLRRVGEQGAYLAMGPPRRRDAARRADHGRQ